VVILSKAPNLDSYMGNSRVADKRQLSKFAVIFASGTMLSRVTGLIRDSLIAYTLPCSSADAFFAGFRFANMLRDIVGEGASNAAFVPVLTETLERKGEAEFRELISALFSAMIIILGIISILGFLFMPQIYNLVESIPLMKQTEKVTPEEIQLMKSLTRWIFPYIFFIGLTVFQMGPLFIMRHYSTPSWSPALLNICLIMTCWKGFGHWFPDPAYGLAVGVWLGGVSQFLLQYIVLARRTHIWIPNFYLRHPAIRTVVWLWVPVILGQSAGEVNKTVDTLFAASSRGLIQSLSFANRLTQLPLAMIGLAIATAILPSISRAAANKDFREVRSTLMYGLRECFFLICPAILILMVLNRPIVLLVLQHGSFGESTAEMTAVSLAYYAGGLLFFAWVKIAVAGFYAVKNTITPVIAAVCSMLLNIGLIFLLWPRMGYRGLALSTTLSYTANFGLLYVLLSRRFGVLWDAALGVDLLKIALASAGMAVILFFTRNGIQQLLPPQMLASGTTHIAFGTRLMWVLVPCATGGVSYLGLCAAFRMPDIHLYMSLLRWRKIRK
jgi:putative peptidoglycan lipid II flippase